ncbi:hypothetical protein SAMN05192588_2193 [Nonlabens sp. Hel1_33_55]|uniref:hypothetical protein n=1 Tax=Nonlabens sp. Hel1_33_55 TaxID=1336802 RepID=UPI000875B6F1|nr:hypothetical protein [Nonlabens sp. Hel1_33_55]SCY31224.1 hypothetical protein SAMN05192588_2193 [Nonlabens sp. Hel1_33_55]
MKKILLVLSVLALFACQSDDDIRRNPFLVDISFQIALNTDLPQYSSLNFANNFVVVNSQGIRGLVVFHLGNDQFVAYELSDPNHSPSSCSAMNIEGIIATCPCTDDDNTYNIIDGRHQTDPNLFPMKPYRVSRQGTNVVVSN